MSRNELEAARARIDALDDEILQRVSRRAALALETARAKRPDGPLYDPAREAQVLRRIRAANPGPLTDAEVARLFREIMSACLALEQPTRVAYLGPEGTFTHQAALRHFGHSIEAAPRDGIDEIFREVASGQAEYGVAPIENSSDGAVAHTLDLFIGSPLKIAGEIELPVHHHLLAAQPELGAVRRVRAHLQAFAQCRRWLDRALPEAPRVSDSSNAAAARYAAEHPDTAAIAPRAAAEQYGLQVLAANIEDQPDNRTRFLVIGRHDQAPSGDDKTSVLASAANRPGALAALLQPLAAAGIDLTRVESRPQPGTDWGYVFFLDLRGHAREEPVAAALARLREAAALYQVLGSYPRAPG